MNAPELKHQIPEACAAVEKAVMAISAARAAVGDERDLRGALMLMEADASALLRQLGNLRKLVQSAY